MILNLTLPLINIILAILSYVFENIFKKIFSTTKTLSPKGEKRKFSQFSRSINIGMSSCKKKIKVEKDLLAIGFVESNDDCKKKYLDPSNTAENKT